MFTKDNPLNIIFVGRLEKEKWVWLLMECIHKTMIHTVFSDNVQWHIIWEWKYTKEIKALSKRFEGKVFAYGYQPWNVIVSMMSKMHLSFVPSLFLETFWLVALESLAQNVPVCGFKKWWLSPFVVESLALQKENTADSFLKILEQVMKNSFPELPNLDLYRLPLWREELKLIVRNAEKILLVHDYFARIWGAEVYIHTLKEELMALGRTVKICNYEWSAPKWKRRIFALLAPFSFWHKSWIKREIVSFQPDLIWIHGIARYIWPFWLKEILKTWKETIITHHDLGLLTARPSNITEESQIPSSLDRKAFIANEKSPIEIIARTGKYLYLKSLWIHLRKVDIHLVPSDFMKKPIEDFWAKQVEVFPHCIR